MESPRDLKVPLVVSSSRLSHPSSSFEDSSTINSNMPTEPKNARHKTSLVEMTPRGSNTSETDSMRLDRAKETLQRATDTNADDPYKHFMHFSCFKRCLHRSGLIRLPESSDELRHAKLWRPCVELPSNSIQTSKYTIISFIPKALLEQFRRAANIYFLVISVLMVIGTYAPTVFDSPLSPFSTLGPLILVLVITMIKEGLEDAKRHSSDRKVNGRKACYINPQNGCTGTCRWDELRVGQVVLVKRNEEVPVDMIVFQTSEAGGQCYVETSNIDGETDLKLKSALPQISCNWTSVKDIACIRGDFECDLPNDSLHVFNGSIILDDRCLNSRVSSKRIGVTNKNVVLRGSRLRNTHWAVGLVTYTGSDTKVMKKSGGTRSKLSKIEKTMNQCLVVIFGAQFVLCTVTTVAVLIWDAVHDNTTSYLRLSSTDYALPRWLGQWFTYLILFNNFIPISLYVTVEMVNYMQAFFIDKDVTMYDPECDTPAKARTSNINQDLGQIEYVFSDKTGTLTRNIMEFRMFSIAGEMFGLRPSEMDSTDQTSPKRSERVGRLKNQSSSVNDSRVQKLLNSPSLNSSISEIPHITRKQVEEFFIALSVCHTVVPEENHQGEIEYQAESPDEGALVRAAKEHGFYFRERKHDSIIVSIGGKDMCFEWLGIHEFNSDRKRMSVVIRAPSGKTILYCKGADDVICKRCKDTQGHETLFSHLSEFGSEGLRTLVVASREMSDSEVEKWQTEYQRASGLSTGREDALKRLAEQTEIRLEIVGATAIEDRLQDGVADTIRDLRHAGIKTWVLTGDKVETAINIGRSCQLLDASIPDENIIRLSSDDSNKVWQQLDLLESRFSVLHKDPRSAIAKLFNRPVKKLRANSKNLSFVKGKGGSDRMNSPGIITTSPSADVANKSNGSPSGHALSPAQLDELAQSGSSTRSPLHNAFSPSVDAGVGANPAHSSVTVRVQSPLRTTGKNMDAFSPETDEHMTVTAPKLDDTTQIVSNIAVVVTGDALGHILGRPDRERQLLLVATLCRSVIACRVSPSQKAKVVAMVRRRVVPTPMTLAIGDGANDVNMLQKAEVGVGISGKEGLQAVNASDFAIAQFRFLSRLMLIHGRWNYVRMSKVVLYSFYKNIVITFTLFAFNAFTGFSGTSFYESLVYSGYNFFLGLPIIMVGLFDKDLSSQCVLNRPEVYVTGLLNMHINIKVMVGWLLHALVYAVFIFFIPLGAFYFSEGAWAQDGKVDGLSVAGHTTYTALILAMQLRVARITRTWTVANHIFLWLSIAGYFAFIIFYSQFPSWVPDFYGVVEVMWSRPAYWMSVFCVLAACFVFDISVEYARRSFFQSPLDSYILADNGITTFPEIDYGDEAFDQKEGSGTQSPTNTPRDYPSSNAPAGIVPLETGGSVAMKNRPPSSDSILSINQQSTPTTRRRILRRIITIPQSLQGSPSDRRTRGLSDSEYVSPPHRSTSHAAATSNSHPDGYATLPANRGHAHARSLSFAFSYPEKI